MVSAADSQILYQSNYDTSGTTGWSAASGTWVLDTSITPGAYKQSASGNDYRSTYTAAGSTAWKNYTLTLQARKLGGSEGFLVMFNVADSNNWCWWNMDG